MEDRLIPGDKMVRKYFANGMTIPRMKCKCGKDVKFGDYSRMVTVTRPWDGETASIDECLYEEILRLWRIGIKTSASCCGHNLVPGDIVVYTGDIGKMISLGYQQCPHPKGCGEFFYSKSIMVDPEKRRLLKNIKDDSFKWDYNDYSEWARLIAANFTTREIERRLLCVVKRRAELKGSHQKNLEGPPLKIELSFNNLKYNLNLIWALKDAAEIIKIHRGEK